MSFDCLLNHPNRGKIKDWSAYIKAFRARHGLTQKQLAERLPAAQTSVEDWERDECKPSDYLKRALRDLALELTTVANARKPSE